MPLMGTFDAADRCIFFMPLMGISLPRAPKFGRSDAGSSTMRNPFFFFAAAGFYNPFFGLHLVAHGWRGRLRMVGGNGCEGRSGARGSIELLWFASNSPMLTTGTLRTQWLV
jgi:hypothetical protein